MWHLSELLAGCIPVLFFHALPVEHFKFIFDTENHSRYTETSYYYTTSGNKIYLNKNYIVKHRPIPGLSKNKVNPWKRILPTASKISENTDALDRISQEFSPLLMLRPLLSVVQQKELQNMHFFSEKAQWVTEVSISLNYYKNMTTYSSENETWAHCSSYGKWR